MSDADMSLVQGTLGMEGPTGAPGVGEKGYTGERGVTGLFNSLPIAHLMYIHM